MAASDHLEMKQKTRPRQRQKQPGLESKMRPAPEFIKPGYKASGRLTDRVALITGGDSGIGRSVALAFALEGADIAFCHLPREARDAADTASRIRAMNRKVITFAGDVGDSGTCRRLVEKTVKAFGRLDIVVNNAGEQHVQENVEDITDAQIERTFRTNIFSQFYTVRAALPHLKAGASIINTASVTAYAGKPTLIDYSATKGAIVSFTRALALNLAERKIRVNAVAPGPIWTPLIPATFPADEVAVFGTDTPLGRAGQPSEVSTCFVFLASDDASYVSGQVLHPNGGRIVNG